MVSIMLWLTLIVLQGIDVWSTWYALEHVNGAYEKNPIMRWAFALWGIVPALIGVKVLVMAALWLLNPPVEALTLVVVMYLWVAFNNLRVIADN